MSALIKAALLRGSKLIPLSLELDLQLNEKYSSEIFFIPTRMLDLLFLLQSTGTASDTSARAARAQSTSFCTVGAPLTPIAPTTSPFTLMGNPPPHAATRASVGMPA